MTTFDSTKASLNDLLREIREGKIQLPDFQRGWVWDDDHIRDLLVSIARSFPIGAVMLLEAGGEVRFETRPVEGLGGTDPQGSSAGEADSGRPATTYHAHPGARLETPVRTTTPRARRSSGTTTFDIQKASGVAACAGRNRDCGR